MKSNNKLVKEKKETAPFIWGKFRAALGAAWQPVATTTTTQAPSIAAKRHLSTELPFPRWRPRRRRR